MKKVKVQAKKGTRCPREGSPRKYITDSVAVEISLTPYYRACIRDGSLVEVTDDKTKNVKEVKKK